MNALYALQGALVQAGRMAHERAEHDHIAEFLDYLEDLPRLIAAPDDHTERYRTALSEMAGKYRCQFVLERFDESPPPENW